jgi:hypothetical protein
VTTSELKALLRRRYPAAPAPMPGPWTVLEEYANIDMLAFCAWSHAAPARRCKGINPIIGHELKISRSDYRRELLRPDKRSSAVARCTEFYFVTPKGLLSDEEKAYLEPEHFEEQAFQREPCPAGCTRPDRYEVNRHGVRLSGRTVEVPVVSDALACDLLYRPETWAEGDPLIEGKAPRYSPRAWKWVVCETCEGRGYMRKSVVETEAPTLWIPRDVGLIEASARGCSVVRRSPINHEPAQNWSIAELVRWTSLRPDPRHHEPAEAVAA